jgi:hypothetical protein
MNSRKIFSFFVLIITVLAVNLLTNFLANYMLHYKAIASPLKFTAIGMAIIVAIFYPAFKFLDELIRLFAEKIIKKGRHVFGKNLGFLLMFLIVLFSLYCIYAHIWFRINVVKVIIGRVF